MIPGSVCEARNATSKVASAKRASCSLVALCGSSSRASAICLRTFQRHRADAADNGLHLAVAGLWGWIAKTIRSRREFGRRLSVCTAVDATRLRCSAARPVRRSGSCSRSWSAGQALLRRPAAPFHPRSEAPRIISARVAASVIGALERHEQFLRLLIVFATPAPSNGHSQTRSVVGGQAPRGARTNQDTVRTRLRRRPG